VRAALIGGWVAFALATVAGAPQDCPHIDLPAYAHNDYYNKRPLFDALRLGYRGVEADVFLIDGVLRVGHDRGEARKGGTLEELYFGPLEHIVRTCEWIVERAESFLLNVELKQKSRAAFDSLATLVRRYGSMLTYADRDSLRVRPIMLILVGWQPARADMSPSVSGFLWVQHKIESIDVEQRSGRGPYRALASIDFGKTIGRSGGEQREPWLRTLRQLQEQYSWTRVYDVPVDDAVYRELRANGANLIGTRDLEGTRRLLVPMISLGRCYTMSVGPWVPADSERFPVPLSMPTLFRLDSAHAEGFLFDESPNVRTVTVLERTAGAPGTPWVWEARFGRLHLLRTSGFGGDEVFFDIVGDSLTGTASTFTDAIDERHPNPRTVVAGRRVRCP